MYHRITKKIVIIAIAGIFALTAVKTYDALSHELGHSLSVSVDD